MSIEFLLTNKKSIELFKDLEAELLSHREALAKASLCEDDSSSAISRLSCSLDRANSLKQRLNLDVARWRNLSGHLEELAAWAVSRQARLKKMKFFLNFHIFIDNLFIIFIIDIFSFNKAEIGRN